jgi:hypothetical protein
MTLSIFLIFKFFVWFSIGMIIFKKLANTKKKYLNIIFIKIQYLTFFELFIIFFTFFILISMCSQLFYNYLNLEHIILKNTDIFYNWMTDATNTANTNSTSTSENIISKVGDSAIMAAGLSGGIKLAQAAPTLSGKVAGAVLGVTAAAGAIVAKNVASAISTNIIKKTTFVTLNISTIFNSTGNDAIDLLNLIQFFQTGQIITLFFICFYLLIFNINESKLDSLILKYLPSSFNIILEKYNIKNINFLKKSILFLLIYFFILLLIFTFLSYYYLDFIINNLDKIVEIYLKK